MFSYKDIERKNKVEVVYQVERYFSTQVLNEGLKIRYVYPGDIGERGKKRCLYIFSTLLHARDASYSMLSEKKVPE